MRIRLFGGFAVEHAGAPIELAGAVQRGLLFRLALDPGTVVGYRALAEDVWPDDPPENPRASLQTLVSRLRPRLPEGTLESAPGGYRLLVAREEVDAVRFQDLVAEARAADPSAAAVPAADALRLWTGEPWTPGPGYDWLERDLAADRRDATRLSTGPAPLLRSTVPAPLTELVGRGTELAAVDTQLGTSRLVTILGPGGAGKTRLAVEIARSRPSLLVELAPSSADEVWQAILGAVGREVRLFGDLGGAAPASETVARALAGRDVLLVLDNCEHVIAAVAEVAADLLGGLPRLRILATSREPLGVPGEAFVPLGPLDQRAAADLFAERVQQARGTAPTVGEARAAARIRGRLDGLPLALELAAAKARTLTLEEIAAGLDDRFALLSDGPRTVLPRHRTLRALVDWSWDLLDDGERRALVVSSAYAAGIATADVSEVAEIHGIHPSDLDALVDRSLLRRVGGRYRALETIREYGLRRLAESGRTVEVRATQAERLVRASEREDPRLRGAECLSALAWFDAEDDNVIAALRWAADEGRGETLVRLAAANAWYWTLRDRNEDALTWIRAAAPAAALGSSDPDALITAIGSIFEDWDGPDGGPVDEEGILARMNVQVERLGPRRSELLQVFPVLAAAAAAMFRSESLPLPEIAEGSGRTRWADATIVAVYAAFSQNQGDVRRLGEYSARAVAEFEEIGDLWGLALARQTRAEWLVLDGQLEEALELSDRASDDLRLITSLADLQQQQQLGVLLLLRLDRAEEARERVAALLSAARGNGAPQAIVQSTITAATMHVQLDEPEEARRILDEAETAIAELPRRAGQVIATVELLRAALDTGDRAGVRRHLEAAVDAVVDSRDHPVMAQVALGVGIAALDDGHPATAATALRLARVLRGAPDATDPRERRIAEAVPGVTADGEPGDRASAVQELRQIFRR